MRILFLSLLLATCCFADDEVLHAPKSAEVDPLGFIAGCVSVLSGDFIETTPDVIVNCHEPIALYRIHVSSPRADKKREHSEWRIGTEYIRSHLKKRGGFGSFKRVSDSGAVHRFQPETGAKWGFDFAADRKWHLVPDLTEYTNTSGGHLSGQTHRCNERITCKGLYSKMVYSAGNGERRIYKHVGQFCDYDRWRKEKNENEKVERWYLAEIIRPNGNRVLYRYDDENRLIRIRSTDARRRTTFGWINLEYDGGLTTITTSDGQHVTYDHGDICDQKGKCRGRSLRNVTYQGLRTISYGYNADKKVANPLALTHRIKSGVAQLKIAYWARHDHMPHLDKRVCQLDIRRGYIRSLDTPDGRLYDFEYEYYEDERGHVGSGHVWDAAGSHTVYAHENFRIDQVIRTLSPDTTLTIDQEWDGTNLTARRNSEGVSRIFAYDDRGNVVTDILEGNLTGSGQTERYERHFTYSDDGRNLLLSETDGQLMTNYTYQRGTNLLLFASNGYTHTLYQYDHNGALTLSANLHGSQHLIQTNLLRDDALPVEIEESTPDLQLRHTQITYDERNRPVRTQTGPFSSSTQYDDLNQPTIQIDPLGVETHFRYDSRGNCTAESTPATGRKITYVYDKLDRLIRMGTKGRSQRYTYDSMSRPTTITDSQGNSTNYTYDQGGRCTHETLPAIRTGPNQWARPQIHRTFDALDRITSETDPLGYTTTSTYTARDQIADLRRPDGTTQSYRYNLAGHLISQTAPNGTTTLYERDPLGRELSTQTLSATGQLLSTTSTTYDGPNPATTTDPNGTTTHYTYDSAGRLIQKSTLDHLTLYAYDALGRLAATHESYGPDQFRITRHTYDPLDRILSTSIHDTDETLLSLTTFEYDPHGNLLAEHSHQSSTAISTTRTEYDPLDRPILITDPLGQKTYITYEDQHPFEDTRVLKTTTTDPAGIRTITYTDSHGHTLRTQTFNPFNTLLAHVDSYYDLAGHLVHQDHHAIADSQTLHHHHLTWTYGPCDQLLSHTNDTYTSLYTYNAHGQLATTTKPDGTTHHLTYDPLGRLHTHTGPDFSYTYTYDPLSNPIHIASPTGDTTRTYDPHSNLIHETLANSLTISYTYDPLSRRTSTILPTSTTHYTHDALHLLSVTHDSHAHHYLSYDLQSHPLTQSHAYTNQLRTIAYDLLGRPTYISDSSQTLSITYDPLSNPTTIIHNDTPARYAYDELSQLTTEPTASHSHDSLHNSLDHTLTFDANNCLTHHQDTTYTYDSLNRLTTLETPTETLHFTYDAFNRRLSTNSDLHLFDHNLQIATYGPQTSHLRVLGATSHADIGAPILIQTPNQTIIPIHDHLGSPIALTGDTDHQITYTAFGIPSSTPIPYSYLSKPLDGSLLNFHHRHYNPSLSIFLTPDPLATSPNLHNYCLNRPLTLLDLYGLSPEDPFDFTWKNMATDAFIAPHRNVGRALEFTSFYLMPVRPFQKMGIWLGRGLQGKPVNWERYFPGSTHGRVNVEFPQDPRINHLLLPGVGNTEEDILQRADTVSRQFLSTPCSYVNNPTANIPADGYQAVGNMWGIPHDAVGAFVRRVGEDFSMLGPDGIEVVHGHSQGALVGNLGLKRLSDAQRRRLHYYTYGSPRWASVGSAAKAENWAATNDAMAWIALMDSLNRTNERFIVRWIKSPPGFPGSDHLMMGDSYKWALRTTVAKEQAALR